MDHQACYLCGEPSVPGGVRRLKPMCDREACWAEHRRIEEVDRKGREVKDARKAQRGFELRIRYACEQTKLLPVVAMKQTAASRNVVTGFRVSR